MGSEPELQNPHFVAESHHETSHDPQVGAKVDTPHDKIISEDMSRDNTLETNRQEQRTTRNESVATTVEGVPHTTKPEPMDKIETTPSAGDRNDSDDHTLNPFESVKHATKCAKRKLYLHDRHRKNLSKQFTPGSASKHLGLFHHGTHKDEAKDDTEAQLEPVQSQAPTFGQNVKIMFTTFPYWNMAFWSGWCYSIGSAMFIIDGAWSFSALAFPESEFPGEEKYGVPLMFFFGACLYQIGGVMAYLEAVNDGSFAGAAMKRLLQGHQDIEKELLDAKLHTFFGHLVPHHHHDDSDDDEKHGSSVEKKSSNQSNNSNVEKWESLDKDKQCDPEEVYAEAKDRVERRGGVDHGPTEEGQVREYIAWRWWPSWHAFCTYHIFELGYVACAIQLFGVTLYGVTSVVVLPGILDSLVWWQKLAAYWIPQVVASVCFLVASIMFTIMAQDQWYKPKWNAVSWWIGIWAQVGSVGFLLCAIFGLYSNDHTWGEYQSSLSSTWGSFFYMTSGLFQWYEAINVNVGPVLAFPNNRTPVLLRRQK